MAAGRTSATRPILDEWVERYDRRLAKLERRYLQLAAHMAQKALGNEVRIEPYIPYINAPNSWLPVVEARIRDSIFPGEKESEISTEWLTEDAANAAIAFFRTGADLLPTEPHIYATKSGDLVAEFETPAGSMTGIVSDNKTILFAVLATNPHEPIQSVIRRGSNRFRDELRSFTRKLTPGSHGKMAAPR